MSCELCNSGVRIERCNMGAIHMRLCSVCAESAATALAAWMLRRMREVQREQDQRARHALEERDVSALTGSVGDELLPATTLRAQHGRRDEVSTLKPIKSTASCAHEWRPRIVRLDVQRGERCAKCGAYCERNAQGAIVVYSAYGAEGSE